MKTPLLPRLALPLVLLAALPAFRPAAPAPGVVLPAETRETRSVAAFSKLTLATAAEVIVTPGSSQKVEVVGEPADLKDLETVVENGRLRIGTPRKSGLNWRGFRHPVKVYVTVTTLEALSVSGSGSLHADSPLTGKAMSVSVSGSGSLRAPLQVESLDASVSGSGSLRLSGSTRTLKAGISGSGRIEAAGLQAATCGARISGSGTCRLNVAETLDAHISGSGDVLYAGSPRVTSHIAGSGRVRKS